jgi:hypothetical protein
MARLTLTKETTSNEGGTKYHVCERHMNWHKPTHDRLYLAAYLSIPEMALEWIVEPG